MAEWYTVTVTSQQRTSFGTGGERAYLTRTYPFLPGSVLRGALAAAWLRDGGRTDEDFREIFECGRFSPAFPAWVQVESQSVSACRYHQPGSDHDEYIDRAFWEPTGTEAGSCGAGREQLKGACTRAGLVTQVATAIEPRRNTVADGQLFAREMIEKGTEFTGHIVLPDGTDGTPLERIGLAFFGGRSSVLGRCTVRVERRASHPAPQSTGHVVVRTLSPTILVDDAGLPSTDLGAALERVTGARPSRLWASRAESGLASGWHSASGLPKPAEIALSPGAVAVLDGDGPDRLTTLLDEGLGLRRSEGYGWVELVHQPWEPASEYQSPDPVVSRAGGRKDEAQEWRRKIDELSLNTAQAQWLANQLQRFTAGQDISRAMSEPVARSLSDWQRGGGGDCTGVEQLLRELPDSIRNSVASDIRRSAGR